MTMFKTLTEREMNQVELDMLEADRMIHYHSADIHNAQHAIWDAVADLEKARKKNDFSRTRYLANRITKKHETIERAEELLAEWQERKEVLQRKLEGWAPIQEYLEEVYEKDMEWHREISAKVAGMSMNETYKAMGENATVAMIARMTTEEASKLFKADLKARFYKLRKQIEKVVGSVKEFNLQRNANISMDGYVIGDLGKANIATFGAGGYNIQRFHYRTKIKAVKFEAAK